MTGSAVVMQPSRENSGIPGSPSGDREQLTHLLRSLAARLDELDRRLSDLAWRQRRPHGASASSETICQRTALENERARLSDRLGVLAKQLNTLDAALSEAAGVAQQAHAHVGTCPYCGYPSLGSGLCAFCRPQLVR